MRSSHQMTGSASAPRQQPRTEERDRAERHAAPSARPAFGLPAIVAGQALQAHGERQQRLGRRPVGVMHQERPADPACRSGDLGAMRGELLLVGRPQGLDAIGDPALAVFRPAELHAPLVGQRLFGRIEDLDQMAVDPAFRQLGDALGDGLRRIEEIAEQQCGREAAEPGRRRQARLQGRSLVRASASAMRALALRLASGGVTPIRAMRSPAAHQQLGEGQRQHHGAVALGGLRQMTAEQHRRRYVRPEPEGVRRLPFALAHVEMVGTRRAPPVDDGGRVARLVELAELPEGLAGARPTAAVDAVRHRIGDAQGLEQQIGQPVGKSLSFALEREHARRAGLARPCRGASRRHPLITPALQPND